VVIATGRDQVDEWIMLRNECESYMRCGGTEKCGHGGPSRGKVRVDRRIRRRMPIGRRDGAAPVHLEGQGGDESLVPPDADELQTLRL
jgi:hypothetical protein